MDSYQEILDRMKAKYKELSGYEADGASDIGIRMQVLAGEVFSLSCYAQWIIRQMFPQTAQGEQLDYHALEQGLTRKPAIAAKGTLSFYLEEAASEDIQIPAGTVCATAGEDAMRFVTTQDATLSQGSIVAAVPAAAQEEGAKGNVAPQSISVMVTPPAGIAYVKNTVPFTGGEDEETDEHLRRRILENLRNPPRGTNSAFYKQAAESVDGVYSAGVAPKARGTGTVNVYIAKQGTAAPQSLVEQVQEKLEAEREINVDVLVASAQAVPYDVHAEIEIADGYTWSTIESQCEQAIRAYFDTVGVGQAVRTSGIGEAIFHVAGVKSYIFDDYYTNDIQALASQLYVVRNIVLTERGST